LTRLCLLVFSLGIALLTLLASAAEAQVSAYGMVAMSSYGSPTKAAPSTFSFNRTTRLKR
jgi:hypothetical protein